jgi:photosystem II stability/assembly factor-like uncharacterized protein
MRMMIVAAMAAATTCALGAPTAGAAVSSPTSGWFWGDPRPQGNQVDELAFAGSRGYAAGKFGAALRTDDGGATWSGLRTGLTSDVGLLAVPNPDTVFLASGCSVRRSIDGGATFRRVRFSSSDTSCRSNPAALAFLTPDLGYVAAVDGTVQFTSDGGQSFSARTAIPNTRAAGGGATPASLVFLTSSVGFAATSAGQIFQTADGGNSWTQRLTGAGSLRDLTFADANTAYAVGDGSKVYASADGGASWNPAAAAGIPGGLPIGEVSCSSASTCVAVALGRATVLRTSDGWATVQESTPSTQGLFAASFATGARVVVAGRGGTTRVSDNAGATFALVGGSIGITASRLRPGPGGLAYAPGPAGAIGVTADGGQTWGALTANTPDAVVDVSFPTASTGYAVDSSGLVLKTVNGGASWTQLDSGSGARRAILAPAASTVLLIGNGIRRSTNGETFDRVSGLAGRAVLRDGDQAGAMLFAWGAKTILASRNGGRTWTQVRKPGPRLSLRDLDFVTSDVGFLVDTAGRLYRTTNRGRGWTELVSLGTAAGFDLSFFSANSGYVATSPSSGIAVMRTSDGGRTFAPQLVDPGGQVLNGLLATGPATALLAADTEDAESGRLGPALFGTATGGQGGTPTSITLSSSPRSRARAGNVKITGRLKPAEGGELITVSRFDRRRGRWATRSVRAASNGSFSTTWRISRTAAFVATWRGDDDRAGDGSPALTVRVGRS